MSINDIKKKSAVKKGSINKTVVRGIELISVIRMLVKYVCGSQIGIVKTLIWNYFLLNNLFNINLNDRKCYSLNIDYEIESQFIEPIINSHKWNIVLSSSHCVITIDSISLSIIKDSSKFAFMTEPLNWHDCELRLLATERKDYWLKLLPSSTLRSRPLWSLDILMRFFAKLLI